jgi:intracellular septation protein A
MHYKPVVLFFASFATVFLLGVQTINIVKFSYTLAFVTSMLISWSSYYLYKLVPNMKLIEFISYTLGGAIGIVSSMYVYEHFVSL